jgi:hypothetical protein
MGFKEQCRAQMDTHWSALEDIMTIVSGVRADSMTQSQRFTAQLDGLRSATEQATTTACNNILDISDDLNSLSAMDGCDRPLLN